MGEGKAGQGLHPGRGVGSDLSLRSLRVRKGWSVEQLAERSGVGVGSIIRTESGETTPRYKNRRKLLEALGQPWAIHKLVFGVLPKPGGEVSLPTPACRDCEHLRRANRH